MPTYTPPTNRVARLAMGASVLLCVAVAASYAARSQPPPDSPPHTVRVKLERFFDGEPPDFRFHVGWIGGAFFHCATASSTNQVAVTVEVWKDGKLVASDGPNGIWEVNNNDRPFDIRASISVTEYPGNALMIRKNAMSTNASYSKRGTLEVTKPATATSSNWYLHNRIIREVVLSPGEETVVCAMKWIDSRDVNDKTVKFGPDGNLVITEEDKADMLIVLKMKLYPWYRE